MKLGVIIAQSHICGAIVVAVKKSALCINMKKRAVDIMPNNFRQALKDIYKAMPMLAMTGQIKLNPLYQLGVMHMHDVHSQS
jgi:hypothetical protein